MKRVEQPESFGDRLARLRRSLGWSQKELAARVGQKSNQISKWERGTYEPRFSVVVGLAAVLGTSTDYLLTGKEELVEPDRLADLWPALERLPLRLRNEIADFLKTVLRAGCLFGFGAGESERADIKRRWSGRAS
jgi:transcriptional regulator with XRE-family HTH domain